MIHVNIMSACLVISLGFIDNPNITSASDTVVSRRQICIHNLFLSHPGRATPRCIGDTKMTLLQSLSPHRRQPTLNTDQHCSNNVTAEVKPTNRQSTVPTTDESVFIDGLQRGDQDCYERLVRENTPRLLGVARRFVNEQEAQDAVQEAFVKVFENIGKFRAASCLSTWLHRIVVNACLSRLRRMSTRREVSLEFHDGCYPQEAELMQAQTPWPEQSTNELEMKKIVRSCIARLSVSYRTVILLREIEGYSGEETAHVLGISANLVKVRLHRARRALHHQLTMHFRETRDVDRRTQCL